MKKELEYLKREVRIRRVAESLGMEITGKSTRCFRPERHNNGDQHPSLSFDEATNRFKCFGCGENGDIFDLYVKVTGKSFKEAVTYLKDLAGLKGDYQYPKNGEVRSKPDKACIKAPNPVHQDIYECLEEYCNGLDMRSRDYLKGRRFSDETICKFRFFSIKDYQKANIYMKAKFNINDLKTSGLYSDNDNLIFYKHTLIIPFIEDDRIVYLQGRALQDKTRLRYLNLKGGEVPIYNFEKIKGLKDGEKVYICEGVFDALSLEQRGGNAVAIIGASNFNPQRAGLFTRFDVVLCFDNDLAGKKANEEVSEMFYRYEGTKVKMMILPGDVNDINDFYKKEEEQLWITKGCC